VAEIELSCGEGLAEQSVLPEQLGRLIDAMADVLEFHLTALDPDDEEHAAYRKLTESQRSVAASLSAVAEQMAAYRDLPPAPHDADVMGSARTAEVFERFVQVEEQVLERLHARVAQDRTMLDSMPRVPRS
jgi:hypothetical protein